MIGRSFVLVCVVASTAAADDKVDRARAQVEAADVDYKLGHFDKALDEYSSAYELYPVPALLFNIAQCHKNLKNYERAIFFYEGYLRDSPDAPNRALVEDLLRESKDDLDKQKAPPPPPPKTVVIERPVIVRPAPPSRAVPITMLGAGAALSVAGGVFYYYGAKRGPDEKYVYDDTRVLGGSMIAVGLAAAVVGGYLLVHDDRAPVVAVGSGGAYLGWAGRF